MPNKPDFREIATHPAFTETYQGGLRTELARLCSDLETTAVDSPVQFARLQERVVAFRWIIEQYPNALMALTGGVQGDQHGAHGEEEEETGYEVSANGEAFAD